MKTRGRRRELFLSPLKRERQLSLTVSLLIFFFASSIALSEMKSLSIQWKNNNNNLIGRGIESHWIMKSVIPVTPLFSFPEDHDHFSISISRSRVMIPCPSSSINIENQSMIDWIE
jgi:hypothetical protein